MREHMSLKQPRERDRDHPKQLPIDFFDLEVITNRPDPRMGDRDLPELDEP